MPTILLARPNAVPESAVDSPEDIAEMMAEAARVDAMFQSGAISTLFLNAFIESPDDDTADARYNELV